MVTVAELTGTDAETVEYTVDEKSEIAGKMLRDVHFPKDAVIGTILRGDEIILPRGDDMVLAGDDVIVFALPDTVPEAEQLVG